jgi:hypothetical protein
VGQHQRVVVHVNDLGLGRDALGDLVRVVHGRQAGADVEELADAELRGQRRHRADEEPPRLLGHRDDAGVDRDHRIAGLPVDRVVVLAAHPVVPDPGRLRDVDADLLLDRSRRRAQFVSHVAHRTAT